MQITFFDPQAKDPGYPNGREITVIAKSAEEYVEHRAAILAPSRDITLIDPKKLPKEPDPAWFIPEPSELERLRADVDYIAILQGVDLSV